jgi:uncharacterized membrane protein
MTATASTAPGLTATGLTATGPSRRGYLDWMRGLAVVVMIWAHTLDAWTVTAEKTTYRYWWVMLISGMAAPMFLFLAGVSVSLASGSKLRRGLTPAAAAAPMVRRGFWVWALALLFRVQAFVLSPGATLYGILKVDILNIMGPAIVLAAAVWGLTSRFAMRLAVLVAVAMAFGFATPLIRASTSLAALPDPIEWYFRPWPGRTTFTLFPWAGFVLAGAAAGLIVDRVRSGDVERKMNIGFAAVGATIVAVGVGASFLPSPYPASQFWTSSPSFFFIRVGVLLAGISIAYLWSLRPAAARFSPLRQFGQTSLFIYWIHVEMVYGIVSYPLHRDLPLEQSLVAFVLFTGLMLAASLARTRLAHEWNSRDRGPSMGLHRRRRRPEAGAAIPGDDTRHETRPADPAGARVLDRLGPRC